MELWARLTAQDSRQLEPIGLVSLDRAAKWGFGCRPTDFWNLSQVPGAEPKKCVEAGCGSVYIRTQILKIASPSI